MEVQLHAFLTTAHPGHLTLTERVPQYPLDRRLGGLVMVVKRKIPTPTRNQNLEPQQSI